MGDREGSIKQRRGKRKAGKAGLTYVNDFSKGITRRRRGRGFTYISSTGRRITSSRTRKRIESLAIPPAWRDVWICPRARGHIQAVGRDERGRRQYIYHERWHAISEATKYERMHLVAAVLPRIRRRVRRDLGRSGLPKQRVLAAVVRLMDKATMRVGNLAYARDNRSYGATTLKHDHVELDGITISLSFPGKSGRRREIELADAKAAKVVHRCQEIDGQFLFCYRDEDGGYEPVDSTDVNEYLREIASEPVTAKDFRTWWGSVTALAALLEHTEAQTPAERKRAVSASIVTAAEALGNTPAVCRKSYIHPGLTSAFMAGELERLLDKAEHVNDDTPAELTVDEVRFTKLLPLLSA